MYNLAHGYLEAKRQYPEHCYDFRMPNVLQIVNKFKFKFCIIGPQGVLYNHGISRQDRA
ncbi:hypothetical protein GCM10017706_33610 [Lactococcus lactis subsp. hordniae]